MWHIFIEGNHYLLAIGSNCTCSTWQEYTNHLPPSGGVIKYIRAVKVYVCLGVCMGESWVLIWDIHWDHVLSHITAHSLINNNHHLTHLSIHINLYNCSAHSINLHYYGTVTPALVMMNIPLVKPCLTQYLSGQTIYMIYFDHYFGLTRS